MCYNDENQCQKPEDLQDKPANCSEEHIRKCHGEVKEHPCAGEEESK